MVVIYRILAFTLRLIAFTRSFYGYLAAFVAVLHIVLRSASHTDHTQDVALPLPFALSFAFSPRLRLRFRDLLRVAHVTFAVATFGVCTRGLVYLPF